MQHTAAKTSTKNMCHQKTGVQCAVPVYNIEGIDETDPAIVLDRATLADIFIGRITMWDDHR